MPAMPNRMGLGAQVRVTGEDGKVQYNEATIAVAYASSSDCLVHFGLGGSRVIREIEVTWPSRTRQLLRDVTADQILKLRKESDLASPVQLE